MGAHRYDDRIITIPATSDPVVPESCRIDASGPFGMVIFGASGDLARRKLVPALYRLLSHGLLPDEFFILGISDAQWSDDAFRAEMESGARAEAGDEFDERVWSAFSERLYYIAGRFDRDLVFRDLVDRMRALEQKHATRQNRMFYLAVPPQVFGLVAEQLDRVGLSREDKGFARICVEKPFGTDLESAVYLNATLHKYFRETQIYRMDHYLAKETVQNILMFRFANTLFEPVWNNRFIDHVQITVSESLGVGLRAGYYDSSGVVRDMFQNHIMQLLALTAMEPPSESDAGLVRDEKAKVFRSVRPFDLADPGSCAVLGQYVPGVVGGQPVGGYLDEPGVPAGSSTPTFGAFKLFIDNWRWEGVPFYLRSGKRMSARKAEIAVQFKDVPHMMFTREMSERSMGNVMVFRVQPDDGINLLFQTKHPGSKICLNPVRMDFSYPKGFQLSGYERVLLDCLEGDQMLFVREDGVTLNWALWSPIIDRLDEITTAENIPKYPAGSECPREALEFMHRDGRVWRRL